MPSLIDRISRCRRAEAQAVLETDLVLSEYAEVREGFWSTFKPRPDDPANFDQQSAFVFNRDLVSFLIGGNASGTTEAAAFKTAKFLLEDQPPPRRNTPFWVVAETYEQVCGVCWDEKLYGHGHIPECEVQWDQVQWYNSNRGWPFSVPLKPWPGHPDKNWVIEFKSYKQGRRALQARSIGGFWFSEQFPVELFVEVLRGCREYMFRGGMFAEFTPVEPVLCLWVEKAMEEAEQRGYRFYRANTEANRPNLAPDWYDAFVAMLSDEVKGARITGELAIFEGVIYPAFSKAVHVVGDDVIDPFLPGVWHARGVDWGASAEHPFAVVFGYRDGLGDWCIYDEYWSNAQNLTVDDHLQAIVDKSEQWGWPGRWAKLKKGEPKRWVPGPDPHYGQMYGDPSRPDQITAFNDRGIPTSPAANNVYKGIDQIRSLLKRRLGGQPRLLVHQRCKHLVEELRKYRWMRGRKPTDAVLLLNPKVAAPVPLKRDDDTADALRYLIYSYERQQGSEPASSSHQQAAASRRSVQLSAAGVKRFGVEQRRAEGWFDRGEERR